MTYAGSYVAIVTPFQQGGQSIDRPALEELVNMHHQAGTDGIVVAGTTGEAPALSDEEKQDLMEMVLDLAGPDMEVLAGTGASSTAETVRLTERAQEAGCDGVLIVCPPYNKPEPSGIANHYNTVCDQTDIPIILYDNPSRSGVSIPAEVVADLADREQVVAIKEASGDLTHAMEIRQNCDINLLSGSDPLIYPLMALGGTGTISVVANVAPERTSTMVAHALEGDLIGAREIHRNLYPLMDVLGWESNPIPVKAALALQDRISPDVRSPLSRPREETRARLEQVLETVELGEV